VGAFPGINSTRKIDLAVTPAYPGPGPAVEGGAKACPDEAAEKDANASPDAALKGGVMFLRLQISFFTVY